MVIQDRSKQVRSKIGVHILCVSVEASMSLSSVDFKTNCLFMAQCLLRFINLWGD